MQTNFLNAILLHLANGAGGCRALRARGRRRARGARGLLTVFRAEGRGRLGAGRRKPRGGGSGERSMQTRFSAAGHSGAEGRAPGVWRALLGARRSGNAAGRWGWV